MDIIGTDDTGDDGSCAPGAIQPHGYALVIGSGPYRILAVSANVEALFDLSHRRLFELDLIDLLGISALHAIRNAQSRPGFLSERSALGSFEINGKRCAIFAFGSRDQILLELEPTMPTAGEPQSVLSPLSFMIAQFQMRQTQRALLEKLVTVLRHLSGYDRVMAYEFDESFDSTVIAEARSPGVAPFLGLRFPGTMTPLKAWERLATSGIRIIADASQDGVPMVQHKPFSAAGSGRLMMASQAHRRFLQAMDVRGSMTMALSLEDKLWGMIVFHAKKPLAPSQEFQKLLEILRPVLQLKLQTLEQQKTLNTASALEREIAALESAFSEGEHIEQLVRRIAADLMQAFDADGAVLVLKDQNLSLGTVPDDMVALAIISDLRRTVMARDSLPGGFESTANGVGGFLAVPICDAGAFILFRREQERQTLWACAPPETAEDNGTSLPDHAFSTRLETVEGACAQWHDNDLALAEKLLDLFAKAHSQSALSYRLSQQARTIKALQQAALGRAPDVQPPERI